jgi:AraC-like DNA-binding protein
MDVLSDVIAAMRTGRPHSSRTLSQAPWGRRFQATKAAGFHIVLSGTCWMIPPGGDAPIALSVGDVVFLPHGRGHAMADSLSTPLADVPPLSLTDFQAENHDEPPAGVMRPGAETVLLCGAYQLDRSRSHPLLDDLPEVIHLPARLGHQPSLRAAVDLLCSELEQPRPGADITVPALLDVLLLLILRTWLHQRPPGQAATGWAAVLNDPAITAALRGIHGDLARPWTVQDLAAQAGLSRAAFARRFTALAGQPPLAYLTWWRLTTAARLLRHSDAPLWPPRSAIPRNTPSPTRSSASTASPPDATGAPSRQNPRHLRPPERNSLTPAKPAARKGAATKYSPPTTRSSWPVASGSTLPATTTLCDDREARESRIGDSRLREVASAPVSHDALSVSRSWRIRVWSQSLLSVIMACFRGHFTCPGELAARGPSGG